jgi:hypothetical protein
MQAEAGRRFERTGGDPDALLGVWAGDDGSLPSDAGPASAVPLLFRTESARAITYPGGRTGDAAHRCSDGATRFRGRSTGGSCRGRVRALTEPGSLGKFVVKRSTCRPALVLRPETVLRLTGLWNRTGPCDQLDLRISLRQRLCAARRCLFWWQTRQCSPAERLLWLSASCPRASPAGLRSAAADHWCSSA